MKISITISDLSESAAQDVLNKLSGSTTVSAPAVAVSHEEPETESLSTENVSGVLDARGLPWDERIHSGNKKLTDKGVWQKRRGVQQPEIDRVEAELRNTAAPAPAQVAYTVPVAPVQVMVAPEPFVPPAPPTPPTPPVNVPATPAPTRDFQNLMQTISGLFASQLINPDYLSSLTGRIGQAFQVNVPAITDLASQPQMVEYAFTLLKQDGKIN